MDTLASLLGIDPEDSHSQLAGALSEEHLKLMDELVNQRVEAGLSQDDVASRMGVTQPTVSSIEKLGSDLKLSTVRRYALAVGAMISHKVEPAKSSRRRRDDERAWGSTVFRIHGTTHAESPWTRGDGVEYQRL